ncbi:MAG: restriction endonuclease subunit S [Magnetococcus sp. YQC-5]
MAEPPLIDIRPDQWEIVRDILHKHVPDREVWAFGSRAHWTAKQYSDLDLAVLGNEALDLGTLAGLEEDFSESDLPFKVDVVDWATTSEAFRGIIEKGRVLVQEMKSKSPIPHPTEWPIVQIGDITSKVGSGATPTGGNGAYLGTRTRFALIRSQNVFDRYFNPAGLAFISDEQAERLRGVILHPGDLLLNITGDGITFSRACAVPHTVLPACVNQHVAIVRVDNSVADPGYVLGYLTHPSVKSYIESFNAGGSRRAITKGNIESFHLPLPPLPEQRAIARILGALDDKIELNRHMNADLEAMARAVFKDWFVDFGPVRAKAEGRPAYLAPGIWDLFPDSLDDEDKPLGWVVSPLAEIAELNPRERLGKTELAPYLEMSALPTGGCWPDLPVPRPFEAGSKFQNGDTLLARITPCLENGKTAFIRCLEDGQVGWGSTEFIVIRPKKPFPEEFGYLLARDARFREFAIQSMTGTSGRQRVQVDSLAGYEMTIPCADLLPIFGALVKPWFAQIKANAGEFQTLSRLRDLLLPKLITGAIRVRDAEKAVEAIV